MSAQGARPKRSGAALTLEQLAQEDREREAAQSRSKWNRRARRS